MEARRFEAEQFRTYHPGGKLGAQLTLVRQVMHDAVPLVPLDAPMQDVVQAMTAGGFGITGVVDAEGRLTGVVTDGDLRRNIVGLLDRVAGDIASRRPKTVAPQTLAAEALAIVNGSKISALFVCEDGRPVGLVHLHDLLRIGVM